MRSWGSRYARLVLERCGHNKRRACAVLGISYHTLQAYLRHSPDGGTAVPEPGVESGKNEPEAATTSTTETPRDGVTEIM